MYRNFVKKLHPNYTPQSGVGTSHSARRRLTPRRTPYIASKFFPDISSACDYLERFALEIDRADIKFLIGQCGCAAGSQFEIMLCSDGSYSVDLIEEVA